MTCEFVTAKKLKGQSANRTLTNLCERLVFVTPDLLDSAELVAGRKSTPACDELRPSGGVSRQHYQCAQVIRYRERLPEEFMVLQSQQPVTGVSQPLAEPDLSSSLYRTCRFGSQLFEMDRNSPNLLNILEIRLSFI